MIHRLFWTWLCLLLLFGCHQQTPQQTSVAPESPLPTSPIFALSLTDGTMVILDAITHQVAKTITHPDLKAAREFTVTPDGMLYIALNMTPDRLYDEILVMNAHTGTVITRLKTARSPMFIRWVGQNTVFVSHTSVEKGGFDIVLIDTVSNTVTHRFKSVDLVLDAVATSDTLFFGNDQSLQIYDLKTNIQRSIPIREPFGNSLLLASDPYLYISAGATEDLSGVPCNTSGNNIFRLDRTTGDLETLFSLRRLGLHGLTAIPNQTLIAFDSCVNPEHGQITVFNIPTSTIATQMLVQRDNGLAIMSPVTPQGEIAFFRIGGSVEWYDATTLEARGQTQLPIKGWISSAVVYPDETKVRK